MIIDRYLTKIIFNTIMTTLFMLVSLSGIIKFIDEFKKVGQGNYSTLDAGIYLLLTIPKDIEILFPMAALLGVLLGLGDLAANNELIVMQSSGFSRLRISLSVLNTSIILIFLTMIIGEWIVPISEKNAKNYRTNMIYGKSISAISNGLWIKDKNDYIFIEKIIGKNNLSGVNIVHLNNTKEEIETLRYASKAIFVSGHWKLFKVNESNFIDKKKIINNYLMIDDWDTILTPEKLSIVVLDSRYFSISELYNYIKYLEETKQYSNRYRLYIWKKILSPLSLAVMMLIALIFIFGPLRNVSIGVRLVTGISVSFIFYILDKICGYLSIIYNIYPFLGVLFPNLIFLFISIFLLLKKL